MRRRESPLPCGEKETRRERVHQLSRDGEGIHCLAARGKYGASASDSFRVTAGIFIGWKHGASASASFHAMNFIGLRGIGSARRFCRERRADAKRAGIGIGGDMPAHLFREQARDGQTQPGGAAGGFHGIEAVEQALRVEVRQPTFA